MGISSYEVGVLTQSGVHCCVSPLARMGLTKLKQKKKDYGTEYNLAVARGFGTFDEFTDVCLSVDHPVVSPNLLARLHEIDSQLFLCWELQHYFDHRWHIKLRDRYTGNVQSVLVLQTPSCPLVHESAEYVALTYAILHAVQRLVHQLRHGTQLAVIEAMHEKQQAKEEDRWNEFEQLAEDVDADHRHIQERLSGKRNRSDPGYERGVDFDADGKPFAEGSGASDRKLLRAI